MINNIIHGDCLDVMKSIPDKSVDMILCDLPYGTTACAWDVIIPFVQLWDHYKRIAKDNACICLFGSQPFTSELVMSNISMFKYEIIWYKSKATGFLNSKKRPLKAHENILIFYNNQCKYNPQMVNSKIHHRGQKKQSKQTEVYGKFKYSLYYSNKLYPLSIKFINVQERAIHPTQKPVELFSYLIKTYTDENDLVLDNCAGSGTTAIACIRTNRKFICIEKDKKHYDIAHKRIKDEYNRYHMSDKLLNLI